MLQFPEPVPQEYLAEYRLLSAELDRQLPPKALDTNLLVASWNLRACGESSDVWVAGSGVSPKRDQHSLRCSAEIISRFDVVAFRCSGIAGGARQPECAAPRAAAARAALGL